MDTNTAYLILLCISVGLMMAQLLVADKKAEHIVFAIFCGSLAMVSVKVLSAEVLGPYQYIVGLGTCATCNVIWLVSRALFRGKQAIQTGHIVVALMVALLVMMNQGVLFASATSLLSQQVATVIATGIGEVTQLLSSTVLMLTFWEAIRTPSGNNGFRTWQRYLFAGAFVTGLMLCTVGISSVSDPSLRAALQPYFVAFSALLIMLTTQALLYWKSQLAEAGQDTAQAESEEPRYASSASDMALAGKIEALLCNQQMYLTPNLKMVDIASALNVSEYKVSRVIRHQLNADNFSQLVNTYRVSHAKALLADEQSQSWSVLVIGLESGFSSLSSFNRVFKQCEGCSPSTFRSRAREQHQANEPQNLPLTVTET